MTDEGIIESYKIDYDSTEKSVKIEPQAEYERELANLKEVDKEFDTLIHEIKQAIQEQVEKDHELAREIRDLN